MNSLEVESTYLVKSLPNNLESYPHEHILQGYITQAEANLRLRKKGDKFELTKKWPEKPGDYSRLNESTIYLTEEEFNKFWPLSVKSYERTRYYIPLDGGLTAELDIYHGSFEGFALVEVEFVNEKQRKEFTVPDWFGDDITQFDFFSTMYVKAFTWAEMKPLFEEFLGRKLES